MTNLSQPAISVIITCPNGCDAAIGALRRIREQLGPEDELIVVESRACSEHEDEIRHIASLTQDDNEMTVEGFAFASHDLVLVLEDHALIGLGFLQVLRKVFTNPVVNATTFFVTNGTPVGIGSQALFTFMYGFASPKVRPKDREIVAASFAIRRRELSEWLVANPDIARAGSIRTELVPALIAASGTETPETLSLLHCQTVTVGQAAQAVFLNALRHGYLERSVVARRKARAHARERYLSRPARLQEVVQPGRRVVLAVQLLAISAWIGWWVGRRSHKLNIGERMAKLHPYA